jgi:hypothetical protein
VKATCASNHLQRQQSTCLVAAVRRSYAIAGCWREVWLSSTKPCPEQPFTGQHENLNHHYIPLAVLSNAEDLPLKEMTSNGVVGDVHFGHLTRFA